MSGGRESWRKGRAGEWELSKLINKAGFHTRPGSPLNFGTEPDIVGLPGLHIEVKRCEQLRLSEWTAQAERDAAKFGNGWPILIYRQSGEPWRVVLTLDRFLKMYKAARSRKTPKTSEKGGGNRAE